VGAIEDFISALREACACLPDKRSGKNNHYVMADIGMAAFSEFFTQSPSFLEPAASRDGGRPGRRRRRERGRSRA
jgi:hypothetical protein